jgi:hypothetical protein
MSRAVNIHRLCAFAVIASASLVAGCSDIYYDRRDTVSLDAGDAVATNIATHTIDVWPVEAGERRIVSNGQKMQSAVERYRTNKVIRPVGTGTSSVGYQQAQPGTAAATSVTQ